MNFRLKILILILFGILIFPTQRVLAYDVPIHAYLTNEVFSFYNDNFPDNKISDELRDYLIDGSRREDDFPRWMNHFYDPVHNRGLSYDPAIDPLTTVGTWQKSKDWAQDSKNQNKLTYKAPATIASVLTAIQERKISVISTETNFTWQEAIRYWVNNEKEKAMFTLGHVIHLIQDSAVPDHTRNDAHPPGDSSPYENWTERFTLSNPDNNLSGRLQDKNPVLFGDLESYFDELAKYSNNNFYSKDTIGIQSGYNLPQPDYFKIEGDYEYGIKIDNNQGDYKIFLSEKPSLFSTILSNKGNIVIFLNKEGGDKVLTDYWLRLSTKAVQYGAGVIDLFFQEVEKAKNNPEFIKEQKSFFGKLIESISDFVGNVFGNGGKPDAVISLKEDREDKILSKNLEDLSARIEVMPINPTVNLDKFSVKPGEVIIESGSGFTPGSEAELYFKLPNGLIASTTIIVDSQGNYKNIYTIPVNAILGNYVYYARDSVKDLTSKELNYSVEKISVEKKEDDKLEENQELIEKKEDKVSATSTITQGINNTNSSEIKNCAYSTSQSPSHENLIINEVAWMGTTRDTNDEWIELKNISSQIVGYFRLPAFR